MKTLGGGTAQWGLKDKETVRKTKGTREALPRQPGKGNCLVRVSEHSVHTKGLLVSYHKEPSKLGSGAKLLHTAGHCLLHVGQALFTVLGFLRQSLLDSLGLPRIQNPPISVTSCPALCEFC